SRRPGRPAAPHRRYRRSPAGLPARTEPGHPGTGAAISGAPARTSGGAGRPFVGVKGAVERHCRFPCPPHDPLLPPARRGVRGMKFMLMRKADSETEQGILPTDELFKAMLEYNDR